jgi:biotin-dependent carboxylase-like uncharacterized protein
VSALTIVAPGWATTIQDAGRAGFAELGVCRSGALDAALRAVLNRLVGNPEDAAVLETLGGLRVAPDSAAVVATSAEMAAIAVSAGERVEVEPASGTLWGYVAVRGGIAVEPVLGSRSQDSRSGLGPPPITSGMSLPIGPDPGTALVTDQAPPRPRRDVVDVWPGPRVDWFVDGALDQLTTQAWTVSPDVSRVGARLDGAAIARARPEELPSEGLVTGAVQVPADGRPVVMLADHPTTGGYPVLAVVDQASLDSVVQARPGERLRFRVLH